MSPINESPMIDAGYDISNFRKIDPLFGTLHDFDNLIQKAQKFGIKVFMDFVPNHTSDKHEWFIKSVNDDEKYRDYYIWREGRENNTKPPNNWISHFKGPAWTYNKKRNLWYLHQFERRQPDLNFTNPHVYKEMEDIIIYWLNKGIDGFRVDAVSYIYEDDRFLDEPLSHLPGYTEIDREYLEYIYSKNDQRSYELIAHWKKLINKWVDTNNQEEKILLTEVYYKSYKFYHYGSDVPFNFEFITYAGNKSKPSDFKNIIDSWMTEVPTNAVANWVTSNHDRQRITQRYPNRKDFMITLVMILPGIACIYYGEEIGMVDNYDITWEETEDPQACNTSPQIYQTVTRDPCRTPFQWNPLKNAGFSKARKTWLPVHKNYKQLNLAQQKITPQSYYKLFKTLTKLRSSDILKKGSLQVDVLNDDKVLVVMRKYDTESIVLLVNFSDDRTQLIDATKFLSDTDYAIVVVSSVGSTIKWGTRVRTSDLKLPPAIVLVLTNSKN